MIVYSTYLGGFGSDQGSGIALDAGGSAYVTGITDSTNFPTTSGSLQPSGSGGFDGFVAKLNPMGSALVYSTYLGGGGFDSAVRIAVDGAGNACVTGFTTSTDFPTTSNAFQSSHQGGFFDGFVSKIGGTGGTLSYSSYLGGDGGDSAADIVLGMDGRVYLTGATDSSNFPVTEGSFQGGLGGDLDGFLVVFASDHQLDYGTYLGGSGLDFGQEILLGPAGSIYLTGTAGGSDFPMVSGQPHTFHGGDSDAFVAEFNPAPPHGFTAEYIGLIGTTGADQGVGSVVTMDGLDVFFTTDAAVAAGENTQAPCLAGSSSNSFLNNTAMAWINPMDPGSAEPPTCIGPFTTQDLSVGSGHLMAVGWTKSGQLPSDLLEHAGQEDNYLLLGILALGQSQPATTTANANDNDGTAGEPVSTATGEIYETTVDLELNGPFPFAFVRYYASMLSEGGADGALGTNWMHNFDVTLAVSESEAEVTLFRGKKVKFVPEGGGWRLENLEPLNFQLVEEGGGFRFYDASLGFLYSFSAQGALTRMEDRNGNALSVTPSAAGPAEVADGLGRRLMFTYSNGQLTQIEDQGGRVVSFSHTGDDLTAVVDANGGTTLYSTTAAGSRTGLLVAETKPAGNVPFRQTFDESGRVIRQEDSFGNALTLAYDTPAAGVTTMTGPLSGVLLHGHPNNRDLTSLTDPDGQTVGLAYDQNHRPSSVTDRLGNNASFSYDAAGNLTSASDPLGNTATYEYQEQVQGPFTFHNLMRITHADGTSNTLSHDEWGNIVGITDGEGKLWEYAYNSRGQVTRAENPIGGVVLVNYNADGMLGSHTNPAGHTVQFFYDGLKRLSKVTFPDGLSREFSYDNRYNLTGAVGPAGNTRTYAYDANANLISAADGARPPFGLSYTGNGLLAAVTDPLGATTTYSYDALSRVRSSANAAGDAVTISYDSQGRLASVKDCSGIGPSILYNAEGIPVSISDGLGRTRTYLSNANGWITKITTTLGDVMEYGYDPMGRMVSFKNPLGQVKQYSYDGRGLLSGVTLPGGIASSIGRNDIGQIDSLVDPNGNQWLRSYDAGGRLISETDPAGLLTRYEFDSRNRITTATFPGGSATFGYDAAGNPIRSTYSDGTVLNYSFDETGQLTAADGVSIVYNARGKMVSSNGLEITRDGVSRITAITYAPGKTVLYTYDCRGLLTQVADWVGGVMDFEWDQAGQLIAIRRPNGVATGRGYDADGGVVEITESRGGEPRSSITLQRDSGGRVSSAQRNAPLAPVLPAGMQEFSYDAASQIATYSYDGLGRLVTGGGRAYAWDLAGRLTSFTEDGQTTTLTYDGLGMLIGKVSGGSARTFVQNYALPLPAISTVRESGADRTYYVHFPDGTLLYSIDAASNSRRYYHFDEVGNTLFLTGDAGQISDSYAAGPYGEAAIQTGETPNPFVFQGKRGVMQLTGGGLYWMRFRVYDSAGARFLSRDIIQSPDPQSINPYQYARANPLIFVDPMGLNGSVALDVGNLVNKGWKVYKVGDSDDPTDPNLPARTIQLTAKAGQILTNRLGEAAINQSLDLVQGMASNHSLESAVATGLSDANKGNRLLRTSEIFGNVGTGVGYGLAAYNAGNLASEEGLGTGGIILRSTTGLGAEVLVNTALASNPVVALANSATGDNLGQAVQQVVRVPQALLGDSRAQAGYVKSATTGKYGPVVQAAHNAGEIFVEDGFVHSMNPVRIFEGQSFDDTLVSLGSSIFGGGSGPYVPPPSRHPRRRPRSVSTPAQSAHTETSVK